MESNYFTKVLEELYYPDVSIFPVNRQVEIYDDFTILNEYKLLFNDFESEGNYINYVWDLIRNVERDIIENIIKAKTRVKVLFDIKQLKSKLSQLKNIFKTYERNSLSIEEEALYKHSIDTKLTLSDEFRKAKFYKLNNNINTSYSEDLKELINEENIILVDRFVDRFIFVQINMFNELTSIINLYEDFIVNISSEEFKNKEALNELSFIKNIIPDLEKNKNLKSGNPNAIKTLDIRQAALFYHYLEETELIIQYEFYQDKAFLAHHLTGFSEQNLRADAGFPFIKYIKEDREGYVKKDNNCKNVELYNLKSVRRQVENIIKSIDSDIKRLSTKKNESHP